MRKKARVFLDASVLVAAAVNPNGGSAFVVQLGQAKLIELRATELVIVEAQRNIKTKCGEAELLRFYALAGTFKDDIKRTPSETSLARYAHLIEAKDCHVLAGAEKCKANVLLTLDRKHFFTETLENSQLPFMIQTPADFLHKFRQNYQK